MRYKFYMEISKNKRVQIIDVIRGTCIILMVVYHFFYDLTSNNLFPERIFYSNILSNLQAFFSCVFIVVSGISSTFSRNNLKRGIFILLAGLGVTAVTYVIDNTGYVRFGILHLLGSLAIIYFFLERNLRHISQKIQIIVYLPLFFVFEQIIGQKTDLNWLYMYGFYNKDFNSTDYFPILPYIFVYLFGTSLGYYIKRNKFPKWFYDFNFPPFSFVGRNSILIYLLHQPVCMGIIMLLK